MLRGTSALWGGLASGRRAPLRKPQMEVAMMIVGGDIFLRDSGEPIVNTGFYAALAPYLNRCGIVSAVSHKWPNLILIQYGTQHIGFDTSGFNVFPFPETVSMTVREHSRSLHVVLPATWARMVDLKHGDKVYMDPVGSSLVVRKESEECQG